MSVLQLLTQGDAVSRCVAVLLLLMSIGSWVVIAWKAWLLRSGTRDVLRSIAAFWQSASIAEAQQKLRGFDRAGLVLPAVEALNTVAGTFEKAGVSGANGQANAMVAGAAIGAQGDRGAQLTRALRDALHGVLRRLQSGQILLATVGAIAPFVGLLGTVWGIYRALAGIAHEGGLTIDKVAGPVGEALVMTAAGLAVAIPAVLAYNMLGRVIGRIEAELEGFAHDLLAHFAPPSPPFSPLSAAPPEPAPARPMPV